MKQTALLLSFLVTFITQTLAQSQLTQRIRTYRKANEHRMLSEFMGLLSIPNVVYDTAGIQKTAAYIATIMTQRGIEPQLLTGKTPACKTSGMAWTPAWC